MTLFETNETKSPPSAPKKTQPYKTFTAAQRQNMFSRGVVRSLEEDFNAVANTIPATTPAFNPAPAP